MPDGVGWEEDLWYMFEKRFREDIISEVRILSTCAPTTRGANNADFWTRGYSLGKISMNPHRAYLNRLAKYVHTITYHETLRLPPNEDYSSSLWSNSQRGVLVVRISPGQLALKAKTTSRHFKHYIAPFHTHYFRFYMPFITAIYIVWGGLLANCGWMRVARGYSSATMLATVGWLYISMSTATK